MDEIQKLRREAEILRKRAEHEKDISKKRKLLADANERGLKADELTNRRIDHKIPERGQPYKKLIIIPVLLILFCIFAIMYIGKYTTNAKDILLPVGVIFFCILLVYWLMNKR